MEAIPPLDVIGPYHGLVDPALDGPVLRGQLADLPARMQGADVIAEGRHRICRLELETAEGPLVVAAKSFALPRVVEDLLRRRGGGSKALRAWTAGRALQAAGGLTPRPVACLERRDGTRLTEALYLSVYDADASDFRRELIRVYRKKPQCDRLMRLLEVVAAGVRAMHEAGVVHRDLGNQNIHLRREGEDDWADVRFIDLNRARVKEAVSLRERARDISRLHLPSDLLRIFKEMYFGEPPPEYFERWERRYRARYRRHSRTRKWRHPIRQRRRPKTPRPEELRYPDPKDLWIWDARSQQAISVHRRPERNRLRPRRETLEVTVSTLRAAPGIARRYRALLAKSYASSVDLAGRIGVAVEPPDGRIGEAVELLGELGPVTTLVRFYHHEAGPARAARVQWVRELAAARLPVAAAFVQDRRAVREPAAWDAFLSEVIEEIHPHVREVEIGHAINRVKWGIWESGEAARLFDRVPALQARYPGIRFMGPAGIDFEYPRILPVLDRLAGSVRLGALSHHLYVDRRGAPERPQAGFALLEKLALLRAIASRSDACEDRVVVSEVNWPLRGTGVWSPVGSPYLYPGQEVGGPSVTEEEYASCMIRYLLIALCSGHAERVYWWSLIARGFGLVDDSDPAAWRRRPAFAALKHLLARLGRATFTHRMPSEDGAHVLRFDVPGAGPVVVAWASAGGMAPAAVRSSARVEDLQGRPIEDRSSRGSPVYLLDA